MKIIDLLVKISKGEEVPKKIHFKYSTYQFDKIDKVYRNVNGNQQLEQDYMISNKLNDEVEIIEEEKEIEKGIKPYKQYVEELGKDGYGISEINEEYLDRLSKIVIELINDMRDKE